MSELLQIDEALARIVGRTVARYTVIQTGWLFKRTVIRVWFTDGSWLRLVV